MFSKRLSFDKVSLYLCFKINRTLHSLMFCMCLILFDECSKTNFYLPDKKCNGKYVEEEDTHRRKKTKGSQNWHAL